MASITVRIAGANGDGVESSGALILKVASRSGMQVNGYRGYQSIIRGGHVWFQIRVGDFDQKLLSHGDTIDILIVLNQDAIANQASHLSPGASVIYDPTRVKVDSLDATKYKLIPVQMLDIAVQVSGDPIMRNTVAVGTAFRLMGIDMKVCEAVLTEMFTRKGDKIVKNNVETASRGYNLEGLQPIHNIKGDGKARYVMDGSTALSLGAYASGCNFYAAYPMTPASGILHWFAAHQNKGVFFKQVEDELAAINMAIGASVSGVRAACGSSGGGFSLMSEALGMAGMIETPLVVYEAQRTGPSTGLPTKTEQGDLLFAMYASQGEFPRIVVAPRSLEECFYISAEAFNLADRYQCPVIVLSDLYLSEHLETLDGFDLDSIKIDRGKVVTKNPEAVGEFKRYLYTEDGVSPRTFPGTPGMEFTAPTDEHDEYGDLVSDALSGIDKHVETRRKMMVKRMTKIETMLKNETIFVPGIFNESADYFFVTFGSSTEPAMEAAELLKEKGYNLGVISFSYLMPLDKEKTKEILKNRKLIDLEVNYTAQLAQVIKLNTGIEIEKRILEYDGEAITGASVAAKAIEILKNFK
jgi:2-oxoglutarate/2-oxoacid ferredoxin oxidoreductase subunit alpha